MRRIKIIIRLLLINWKILIGFELIYKILSAAIFAPILWIGLNGIMKLTGYYYLTTENIFMFLRNPVTIAALFILVLLVCIYSMIDISAIIFLLDQSYHRERVSLLQTIKFSLKNIERVAKGENMMMAVVILLLLPFLNMGVVSSFASTLSVPDFLIEYFGKRQKWVAAFVVAMVFLAVLMLRRIYAFHYFTLEKCNFREAGTKSRELSKNNKLKDVFGIALVQILFHLCYSAFVAVGILLVLGFGKTFSQLKILNYISTSAVWGLLVVILFIVSAVGTPISYACIGMLYYFHRENRGDEILRCEAPPGPVDGRMRLKVRLSEYGAFLAGILGCVLLVYINSTEKVNLQIEYIRTMEVTAHRGASRAYPENTMAAFWGAKDQGADWIELDVQQSRDGQIFVMHDASFKRTTGVNKYSWELDYEEIAQLDAGSYFGEEYAGERIPLLEEVIQFAKENEIRLNIELKPSGHETDFEKCVTDIIREAQFEGSCVVTSQRYEVLERVKEYCEDIETVYVMTLAYGNVNRLEAADHFSMEAISVTPTMVSRVHNAGKQLFAWTANTKRTINRMIDLNVDNIITDNVVLAQECIYESKTTDIIQKYVKFLQRK